MNFFRRHVLGICLAVVPVALIAFQAAGLHAQRPAQTQEEPFGKPSLNDQRSAQLVTLLMEQRHLLSHPIDDEISMRAMEQYLKTLDPMKTYFLESDIRAFAKYRDSFDDALRAADFAPAFDIFTTFLRRVDQCTEIATGWLDQQHDFSVDEELVNEPDLISYAVDETELKERWRKRIKYNLLVAMAEDTAMQEAAEKKAAEKAAKIAAGEVVEENTSTPAPPRLPPAERLKKRYKSTARRMHQMDNDDIVEMYITAVTTSFDPHTTYMSRKSLENFMILMGLQLEGIGATLGVEDDGYTVIKRIVPKGPADKQGDLKVEDRIAGVGQGESGEMVDVAGWRLDDVVSLIRGAAGTTVRLSLIDASGSDIREIKIVRDRVELEDEAAQGRVFENGLKSDGTPMKIGVIDLPSFYADMDNPSGGRSTTRDVDKILRDFNQQGVDALVMDLRQNGGGSLPEAINLTGLFVDQGTVVQVRDGSGQIEQLDDTRRGKSWNKPLVVLTSKLSASASEILAGAVQDYGRGLVVGDTTTHGKGTVQSMMDLNAIVYRVENPPNYYGALKISTAQFYRPNGDSTQIRGVLSDIVLPSITDKMDVAESDLDYAVEFDRIPAAKIVSEGKTSQGVIQQLAEKSRLRVAANERFIQEQKKIDLYVEFKNRTALTLNQSKFNEQRKEFNAEEEDRQQIEDQLNPDKSEIRRNYYLDEVLNIASDYVQALGDG